MDEKKKIVRIFSMEQASGGCSCSGNSCCSPVGLNENETLALKRAIEALGAEVEFYDVKNMKNLQAHPEVFKLFHSFGPGAIPIITVSNEVASVGRSKVSETVDAIKNKL